MKLLNFAIIKLSICLIIGILIGYLFPINLKNVLYILGFSLLIFGISFFALKNSYKYIFWFGICSYLCMISIGILNIRLHDATKFKSHFTNQIILTDSIRHTITFRIREILKSSVYHEKYVVDVLEIDAKKVSGKSLLNVQKDSTKQQLKVDNIFTSITQFNELYSPLNPYQFDYKNYLKKQNIYHQLYSTNNELVEVSKHKHTIYGYAARLREHIQLKLKEYNFSSDEYAIISALLLGQRQDISKEIYESYSQAGAIHILAVSGLHVGIVLMLLVACFSPSLGGREVIGARRLGLEPGE